MVRSRRKSYGPEVQVSCHVCRREVPLSEALSADVRDYVVFFCSQPCYDHWFKESEETGHEDRNRDKENGNDS